VSVANVAPPLPRLPTVAPMRKAGLPVCGLRLQVFTATRTPQTGLIVTLKGSPHFARAPLCRTSCFRRARQPLRDAAPVLSIKPGNTPHPEAGTARASLRGHVPRQPHLAARDGARAWIERPGTMEARQVKPITANTAAGAGVAVSALRAIALRTATSPARPACFAWSGPCPLRGHEAPPGAHRPPPPESRQSPRRRYRAALAKRYLPPWEPPSARKDNLRFSTSPDRFAFGEPFSFLWPLSRPGRPVSIRPRPHGAAAIPSTFGLSLCMNVFHSETQPKGGQNESADHLQP